MVSQVSASPSTSIPSSPGPTPAIVASGSRTASSAYRPTSTGRKRRRSTLIGSVSSSGSEDDSEARPAYRLRLSSFVADSSFQPRSPSPLARPRSSIPRKSFTELYEHDSTLSTIALEDNDDMELDAEVDTCFRAMQVHSPVHLPTMPDWKTRDLGSTASIYPSSALVAARRSSRGLGPSSQYVPSASSPLAYQATALPDPHTSQIFKDTPCARAQSSSRSRSGLSLPPSAPVVPTKSAPPSRRNSDSIVNSPLTGGRQMLCFTMGYRQDCARCREGTPGHFSHVLNRV